MRSAPGVGEEKTATSERQGEGKNEIVLFYSPVFAHLAVKLNSIEITHTFADKTVRKNKQAATGLNIKVICVE